LRDNKVVNFETYKVTHNLSKAEQQQRLFDWEIQSAVDFLKDGRIDDVYDCIKAGLLVNQNRTTDYERKYFDKILTAIGNKGFKDEEKELRWRLQKYLKLDEDK
jgi:hypothetical protein